MVVGAVGVSSIPGTSTYESRGFLSLQPLFGFEFSAEHLQYEEGLSGEGIVRELSSFV